MVHRPAAGAFGFNSGGNYHLLVCLEQLLLAVDRYPHRCGSYIACGHRSIHEHPARPEHERTSLWHVDGGRRNSRSPSDHILLRSSTPIHSWDHHDRDKRII